MFVYNLSYFTSFITHEVNVFYFNNVRVVTTRVCNYFVYENL